MAYELIIYCDESVKRGKHFSNFYGGVLVSSLNQEAVNQALNQKKKELNLNNEVKWQRVTENYLSKYIELIDEFFYFLEVGKLKIRIMFTQNALVADNLDDYHKENAYFILYYHFIKHAFGLMHCPKPNGQDSVGLRLNFDKLPDTKEKNAQFKSYIAALNKWPEFKNNGIFVHEDSIAEVDSSDHVLMQCLDIVLGAIQFRLNDLHKEIAQGKSRRGKRTIAKEKLYKHILKKIQVLYPRFNIGTTTAKAEHKLIWEHPYRHWLFKPKSSSFAENASKKK